MNPKTSNAALIVSSIGYLKSVVFWRLEKHFEIKSRESMPVFSFQEDGSHFSDFLQKYFINGYAGKSYMKELIVLLVAFVPNIQPDFFNDVLQTWSEQHKKYKIDDLSNLLAFGGVQGTNYRGIIPTIETVLFITAGNALEERLEALEYFQQEHFLLKEKILDIHAPLPGEPYTSSKISISARIFDLLTTGDTYRPSFSLFFPAKRVETAMEWDDMVLDERILYRIEDIRTWHCTHEEAFKNEDLKRKLKPGLRLLFYGPPGTGKSQVAQLLGNDFGLDVYRIDLSQVVSKYIGETEKNLEKIFNAAEHENWILLFDEADALFGKRTEIKDAHDRYANQEISYLLQRVEHYPGITILTTNFKQNLDQAFSRRFDLFVRFRLPSKEERTEIWRKTFPANVAFEKGLDVPQFLSKYEVSGSNILNAVKYAWGWTLREGTGHVQLKHVMEGIRIEYDKEGKAFKE